MGYNSLAGALRRAAGYIIFAAIGFVLTGGILWILATADSVAIAVGVVFGVMAGIPTAILILAGGRRNE